MTAYNREKYIAEAIESVLNSTYTDFELIIVDDCSNDRTVEIAKHYEALDSRVKVYVNEINLGDYPNRNKAASYANGEYLTYLDSDDLIYSHGLSKMIEAQKKFPDAALYMLTRNHDVDIKDPVYYLPHESYLTHFESTGFLETGPLGTLINKNKFNEIGGFSGKRMISDTELWLKMAAIYPIVKIEKGLVFWRSHDNQETTDGEKYYLVEMVGVYKECLFNEFNPAYKKRYAYLIKILMPRIKASIRLAIKCFDFKKLIYIFRILQFSFK